MYLGIIELEIKIYGALNLKDKRRVLKSLMERIKHRFNFSQAEIDHQDMINLAGLGFVCLSNSYSHTENMLDRLEEYLRDDYRFEIIRIRREII